MRATARATSNIALIKYWGKRDVALNLPATGSISVTLDALSTTTSVSFEEALGRDEVRLGGADAGAAGERVSRFLDLVRQLAGTDLYARVETENDFPTGAGLASSASGFAALTLACDAALGLGLAPDALSALARRGSGSAARSLSGGFVEMRRGMATDGRDAHAVPLAGPDHVPLRLLIAVTATGPKAVGSTDGMRRTRETSPFYAAWVEAAPADLDAMRAAIRDADLARIGGLAESNCLRMHATMLGARPPLLYWNAATLAAIETVRGLRARGTGAWFTIDAGPQVKVICAPEDADRVRAALESSIGVVRMIEAAPGAGAHLVETVT
jgi:diphosphomevalonate decarboxylase